MHPRHVVLALASCFLFASLSAPVNVRAQWQPDGAPISAGANDQTNPTIASDGAGGAIITWRDGRSGNNDIYVQRVNASGVAQWTADGVALCTSTGDQQLPVIASDGAGGAIVAWHDNRGASNYDIFVQRVNASGTVLWTANGVALCTASNLQLYPTIVADGSGGAVVTWEDLRSGSYDIYAQRVNSAGVVQWTANGVVLCNVTNDQTVPTIAADGSGGAIVTWQDYRSATNSDVYTQRVNSAGVVQWVANGVALSVVANDQITPTIIADGAGGAIVTWEDGRSAGNDDIYAQRVNSLGVVQWAANGVAICTASSGQVGPTLISDGSGGAIITWYDIRSGEYDVYAQRTTGAGVNQWTLNGVAVCTATAYQYSPQLTTDGSGGAIITWYDTRNGPAPDVYAQRVSHAGVAQWTPDGKPLCIAAGSQFVPVIAADASGGAIVAWYDNRTGTNHIYAQRVEGRYGYWGHPEPTITSVADIRGDQGGKVKVNWKAGDWDAINLRTITHYSVWRATDVATMQSAGQGAAVVTDPSRVKADFNGKAYWIQHAPATDYYWEWVGNQDAKYLSAYSFATDTRADSTIQSTATHSFMVFSQTADDYTFWPSNILSGHSVDNLAPAAPLFLTALRAGPDVHLKWNRVRVPDLKQYAVYRATATGVTPVPPNFLANDTDTVLVDAGAPATALYYIVTAYDEHENQGKPSNEANVAATTGVGNLPPITALTVLQNRPNPFTTSTALEVGLPGASKISLEVYDVAGRRVRDVEMSGVKGWQQVPLSAQDDRGQALASGVYFYRVHAAGTTITRKMVIAR